jgi:hypothetical protein
MKTALNEMKEAREEVNPPPSVTAHALNSAGQARHG